MKLPAAWITLSFTAGSACIAAFLISRGDAPATAGQSSVVSAIANAAAGRSDKAVLSNETAERDALSAGVLNDATLREALANPDLAAAIRHIMAHEGEDHCADTRLICLIEHLPAARLTELSAALQAHTGNDYVVKFVLGAWAERDSPGALAWVQANSALNAAGVRAFLTGWMRAAPERALAWVDARPLSASSTGLRTAVVETMSETNPAAALEMMKSRGWLANSPIALVKLLHNWGGAAPQAALAGLRSVMTELGAGMMRMLPSGKGEVEHPNQNYTILLRALLHGAYERNPADAAALFASFQPDEIKAGSEAFAQEVLARDPAAGAALFTAHPDDRTRPMLLDLASQNPSLALRNLERIADPALQSELLLKSVPRHNDDVRAEVPPEARATVTAVLAGIADDKQRHQAAGRLAVDNAANAPQWAAGLWHELPDLQQYVFGPAWLRRIAGADPALAVAEFRQSSPEVQNGSLKSLCYSLAESQPADALQLVLEQSHRGTQSESAATLFARWAQTDSTAALAALEQHAAHLDLAAIAQKLPEAGHLRVPFGSEFRSVPAKPVAEKIQQLLGTAPPPSRE